MSYCIIICRPSNLNEENDIKLDDIREKLDDARDSFHRIWNGLKNSRSGSFPFSEISILTHPISTVRSRIIRDQDELKSIATVFLDENEDTSLETNWLQKSQLPFVVEFVCGEEEFQYGPSNNGFSLRAKGSIDDLEGLVKDIFLEIAVENHFRKDRNFRNVINSISPFHLNESKVRFFKQQGIWDLDPNKIKYFPISFYHRKGDSYNYGAIYNLWIFYLLGIAVKKKMYLPLPVSKTPVLTHSQASSLVPDKLFTSKFYRDQEANELLLICLRSSLIGLDEKRKKSVSAILGSNPKIGSRKIISRKNRQMLNEIDHLFYVVPYKLE